MADETLPAEWALDMAAKAAGYRSWVVVDAWAISIIAHARTLEALAKHDPSIMPVDEDLLIAREVARQIYEQEAPQFDDAWDLGLHDVSLAVKASRAALAAFRKGKGL